MKAQLGYRSDIDGLRALAVVPVVLFHVGFPIITGGFLGVDIFFVISGYLITGIINREVVSGSFSYLHFYEKRVRRIFPALFAMIFSVLLIGYYLLFPSDYKSLADSAVASSFSVANIYFYYKTNYFSGDSIPLLHIWSLAVEEQFYLVLPPVIIFVHRILKANIVKSLIAITIFSMVVAQVAVALQPEAAFYQTPFRMWELLLGGVLAVAAPRPPVAALTRNVVAAVGLAMVVLSFVLIDRTVPFPGVSALPTCLGVALVIGSASNDRTTWISQILSFGPVRFVGLISYSLYLWHWPIIVLSREGAAFLPFSIAPNWHGRVLLIFASFVAAVISWKFVEQPLRRPIKGGGKLAILTGVGAMMAISCLAGVISFYQGFRERYPRHVQEMADYTNYDPSGAYRSGTCFIDSRYTSNKFNMDACLKTGPRHRVLLIGDSHAAHLYPGLLKSLPNESIGQITASGCRPVLDASAGSASRCTKIMGLAFSTGISRFRPGTIIISGNWQSRDFAALPATLVMLRAKATRVILVGPVPFYDAALPKLLASAALLKDPTLPDRHLLSGARELDAYLRTIAAQQKVEYFSPLAILCGAAGSHCRTTTPIGEPLQFDSSHLTANGSKWLVQAWVRSYASGI